jgi:outer membrane protein insertion porin family
VLLKVIVDAGPLVKLVFEGNRHFDASDLEDALELDESSERSPQILLELLRKFYVEHGFFDAEIRAEERGQADAAVRALVFVIREGDLLRVTGREYPCLSGQRGPAEVGSEIDSFLSELPGGVLLDAVDEESVDALYGPTRGSSRRKRPLAFSPWASYVPEVYGRAIEHLQNLYRSEGYLSASVGPPVLLRRTCDRRSPPGQCIPVGPRRRPRTECRYDEIGLPLEEPPIEPELTCKPDPLKGVHCEPEAVLHLPIKLGPRSYISEISFEGNETLAESALFAVTELSVGAPASQVELDKARRRMLEAYAEEGFVFAEIDAALELSADHTRARARFIISERDRVRVSRIDLRGAKLTSERLIRSRIALKVGQLYRLSLVRKTEERLATLGVFASVSVGFEDPYVPAREKVVVVTVEERKPQRLDVRPGFSTGEGFRISFEYGHNNLGGQAIGLTLRTQLAYLPSAFIFEDDVRQKYDELSDAERIERRNTITVEFPEIGLGPLFRFSVEGVDVRDNARDYGLTKDAAIVTLTFRPDLRLSFQIGGSLELNDATIFGKEEEDALEAYLNDNPGQANKFRVPDGTTVAIAQRVGATWDRRDRPLDATSGTFVSLGAEHVNASPVGETKNELDDTSPFAATDSDFMRYTNRIAGYVRLSRKGLALAASFRWGFIQQLKSDSRTYPDRLFFLGGGDSVRGFAQDSLVPEDIAQLIQADPEIGIEQVLIRGGDAFVNPRAELRVPLSETVQTALFVDAGNLWADTSVIDSNLRLRYAVGSGIRVGTPIGPLVFDYGFNVDRVLDGLFPNRANQRSWESLGAFHFSIGLF